MHDQLGLLHTQEWLDRFSARIVGLHLHDVIGIKDHQAPGTGVVDFKLLSRYFPPDCYRALEVETALTKEQMAKGMHYLLEQGCINKV